jgi:hypothetical protein
MNWKILFILFYLAVAFFAPSLAKAQEEAADPAEEQLDLRITYLQQNARAPFAGLLMTTDSYNKIRFDHTLELRLMESDFSLARRTLELEFEMLREQSDAEIEALNARIENRDRYIERLEDTALDRRPSWVMPVAIIASFLIGAGATVAITYAVNDGS